MVASSSCPRSHSTRAISKAKIKTVKLTIVVVVGYLIYSAPYVCIQLYASFSNPTVSMSMYLLNTYSYVLIHMSTFYSHSHEMALLALVFE